MLLMTKKMLITGVEPVIVCSFDRVSIFLRGLERNGLYKTNALPLGQISCCNIALGFRLAYTKFF